MATKKNESKKSDETVAGVEEVQAKVDEAEAQGFIGSTPETIPNEEFSLQSGPDSPSPAEQVARIRENEIAGYKEASGL